MALNLQTLTSPTTSSDVIADIENPAASGDLVVTLKNLATESGATTNATQTVSAAQGTAVQGDTSYLVMDLVDDEYQFTTDAAIDGTIVVATTEGTYSANISLDASTQYDLQARGVASTANVGFLKNSVGYLISSSALSASEITQMENYFVDKGAAARSAFGSVTDFNNGWYNSVPLTSFPLIDTSSATNILGAWRSCSSLTSFPLINTSLVTNLINAWRDCTSLTTFPLIDTSSGTNFNSTWRGCTSLTTFPLIDTSSGENITAAWQSCTSLSSFPLIDASAATTVNRTWSTCSSLTSFPAIDIPLSTDFFQTWSTCSSLTSFPLIDVSSGQRFSFAWQKCTNLTTFPAGFFDNWSPTSLFNSVFSETWGLCTSLTAQSVENILTSLDTSGVYGTTTGASGGTQLADNEIDIDYDGGTLSSATATAITNLKSKNWAIVINSVTQ